MPTRNRARLAALIGTDRNDNLDALADGDILDGLAGRDVLRGSFNRTELYGGDGNDRLRTTLAFEPRGSLSTVGAVFFG